MKNTIKFILILGLIMFSSILTSCRGGEKMVYAQIVLTTGEKINLELYKEFAPESVENFVKLAKKGYYKGTIFHRVIKDFMIQTGGYYLDEDNTLNELETTDSIKGEFASNGFETNTLKHELGVISMARTSEPNSATGQFFLCSATCTWLDGEYAAFGKTTDNASNDVILRISNVETYAPHYAFQNFPVDLIVVEDIKISNKKF